MFQLPVAFAAAYGYAIVAGLVLLKMRRLGFIVSTGLAVLILLCPILIPADELTFRALAVLAATELMFKLLDLARHCRDPSFTMSTWAFLEFLVPIPTFQVILGDRRRLPCRAGHVRPALLDMLAGGVVLVTALLLVRAWLQVRLRHPPFALDHAVMLVFFAVFAEALSRLVCGVERLAGYDTSPPMRYALLAGSPAEFWWRWNHRVHGWLMLNVFRPCGGRSAPIRGLALTFLVSGIHHEAFFAVVTERIDGYQLMFFLLQIPAVAASPKLAGWWRQSGRAGRTIGWLVTVTWFYFTSMLFFHGVNRVFPGFYASETWLP